MHGLCRTISMDLCTFGKGIPHVPSADEREAKITRLRRGEKHNQISSKNTLTIRKANQTSKVRAPLRVHLIGLGDLR
jgi:hypothetical protein